MSSNEPSKKLIDLVSQAEFVGIEMKKRYTAPYKEELVEIATDIFGEKIGKLVRRSLDDIPTYRGCDLCAHYIHGKRCAANNSAVVPDDFSKLGCDQWTDDVPF